MESMVLYAIIMSGGRGKRFWPLSQVSLPKQFLHFAGEGTLFQQTYQRLRQLMPADHIYTVTRQAYRQLVLEQVEEFLPENVIVEPAQRNTAPCIALGTAYIQHRAPEATIAVLPADHYIADETRFVAALETGLNYAIEERELVTFGIQPESPHTGFGYIQVGDVIKQWSQFRIHHAQRFIEKPDLETAQQLIASGDYYWNSGTFCFRADVMFEALRQTLPPVHERITAFRAHIGTDVETNALIRAFEEMPTISIDHGVMERVGRLVVIPIAVGWSDVGSWASLRRLYSVNRNENLVMDQNLMMGGRHLLDQVTGSTVVGSGQIVVIGLNDVIVSVNGAYVLVCAKDKEHRIQAMVDQLEED